jgi:hypothetical protein
MEEVTMKRALKALLDMARAQGFLPGAFAKTAEGTKVFLTLLVVPMLLGFVQGFAEALRRPRPPRAIAR